MKTREVIAAPSRVFGVYRYQDRDVIRPKSIYECTGFRLPRWAFSLASFGICHIYTLLVNNKMRAALIFGPVKKMLGTLEVHRRRVIGLQRGADGRTGAARSDWRLDRQALPARCCFAHNVSGV